MPYRLEKFASTLQQALGEILGRDSLNPDFKLVSVTRVQLACDLKKATVFISSPLGNADHVLQQLDRSQGFIKRQLSRKMILRHMPELAFVKDTARNLDERLEQLASKGGAPYEDFSGQDRLGGEPARPHEGDHEIKNR